MNSLLHAENTLGEELQSSARQRTRLGGSLNLFLFLQKKNYPEFDYDAVGYVWGQYIGTLALTCQRAMCNRNAVEDSETILSSVLGYVRCVFESFETREILLMHNQEMSYVQQNQTQKKPLKSWKRSQYLTLS